MKKILTSLISAVAFAGMVYGAPSTVASWSTVKLVEEINEALANPTNTTLNVDGKSTLNGELEVNNSDVDINMTLSANEIDIAQTNATGQSGVALITVTDARTGSTANDTNEATLKLNAAGTYALAINNGALLVDDAVTFGSTLDVTGIGTFRDSAIINTSLTMNALTASYPVFTDGSKILISKKIYNGDVSLTNTVTPQVVTPTATITPQAPSAHTPTITVTPETGAVTASGANNLVTPTATVTPQVVTPTATPTLQTGAITASGANDLVTATATLTEQTGTITASGANNLITPTITVTIETTIGYDSTGVAITNAAGESVLFMTNATATCSPDLASNAVVVVTVTGGDAVWTNATCAITPDLASNSVVAVTITGGDAVVTNLSIAVTPDLMTNATCAITPDLVSNSVVAVSITGGDAVMTNATAASSALPLFATNATCVITPDLMTNAVVTCP